MRKHSRRIPRRLWITRKAFLYISIYIYISPSEFYDHQTNVLCLVIKNRSVVIFTPSFGEIGNTISDVLLSKRASLKVDLFLNCIFLI